MTAEQPEPRGESGQVTERGEVAGGEYPTDVEMCAGCGWLGPWREMFRIKYPNDRRPMPREHGFYLCVNCWDRLCGATVTEAIR